MNQRKKQLVRVLKPETEQTKLSFVRLKLPQKTKGPAKKTAHQRLDCFRIV